METFAICLLPRREYVQRHLPRAEAERYAEVFNRVMRLDGVRAQIVREPVEEHARSKDKLPKGRKSN